MSVAGSASSRGTHSRSRSRSRSPPYSDGRYPPQRYPRYDSYSYRPSRSAISAPLDDYRDIRDRERDRDRDRDRDRPPLPPREDRYIPRGRERDIRYSPYYRDDPPPSHHYNVPPASLPPRDYTKSSASASLRREVSSTDRLKDPKSSTASTFNSEIKDDTRIPGSMSDTYTPPPPRYMDWRDRERERERRYRDEDRWREMDRRGRDRDPYMRYDPPPYGPVPPLSMPPYPSFGGDSYRPDRSRDRDIPASPGGPHAPYYDRDRMDDRDYYRSGPRGPGPADMDRYRGRPGRAWGPASNSSLGRERDRDRAEHSPRSSTFFSSPTPWSRSREESRSDDRRDGGEVEKTERSDTGKLEKPNFAESQDIMRTTTESSSLLSDDADKRPKKSTEKEEEIVKNNQLSQEDKISGTEQPDESSNNQIVETKPTKSDKDDTEQTAPSLDTSMTAKKEPTSEEPVAISVPKPSSDAAAPDNAVETEPKAEHSAQSNAEAINIEPKKQESSNDEAKTEQSKQQKMMTQQEIVERIGQIENDISMYEEMLEAMTRREEAAKQQQRQAESALSSEAEAETTAKDNDDDLDLIDAQQVLKEEAAQKQALQVIEESSQTRTTDIEELSLKTSPIMRKRPQLLINQARHTDDVDDLLSEKLLKENQELAKQNSVMIGGWQGKPDNPEDWSDMDKWSKPLYARIEDYPCYKENIKAFDTIKASIASRLAEKKKMLKKKELRLKREYKALYEQWKQRNLALDRIREHEKRSSEKYNYRTSSRRRIEEDLDDYVDGIIFHGDYDALRFSSDGPTTPYGGPQKGPWTSDAARSEAELLEIIQSLESADMRNPELRAAKTTANIPPMILDAKERMQTYDDRSGLVKDPLSYYHTGPDTEDIWTQQEMTAFMESYMQYPKQFDKIAAAVKTKTVSQCVLFYYRKKTKIDFKALVSKGRRGKAGKRRDKLAAAVRRATSGNSTTTRKAKSKGSALMTDIGEAQVSRKAKEKETERKTREPKDLEEANTYWDSVHDRRRGKRPQSGSSSTSFVEDIERSRERRRFPRRKGRSPKAPSDTSAVLPGDEDEEAIDDSESGESRPTTTAKWTEKDKETAVEAFKTHGRNFAQVASMVGTKTEDQCRNFYHNHKRKYGPNAFNEESEETETRSELNAEEEDAAAALVGMCQMGAPKHTRTLSIQLEEGRQSRASMATGAVGRRRRVRSASGKATDEDATVDWMETEFGGQTGRKPGRAQASSETATRKPTYSSYWSVSERNELKRCLELYGREWDKIASILKTKTATQVRNFYVNNKEKMQLDEIVERRYQTENQDRDVAYDNAASVASTKAHFQVLQNLPFPSPLATDQTPSPAIYGPVPSNVGYYTPPHAAHPSRQHDPAAGVMHAYGPAYGTHAPAPAYPLPPAHHPTHPHSQPQPHPPPPPHIHPQAPPQTESPSTAYSRIPPEGPSASPSAASPPQPQPQPKPTAESSPSVTKVADLLNSDDAGDSTNQGNWESWFS